MENKSTNEPETNFKRIGGDIFSLHVLNATGNAPIVPCLPRSGRNEDEAADHAINMWQYSS